MSHLLTFSRDGHSVTACHTAFGARLLARMLTRQRGAVIADCLNGFNPLSTPSKQGRPVRFCGRFKRELRICPSLRTCPSWKHPLPLPFSLLALPIGTSRPNPLPLLALIARCRARPVRNCGRPLLTIPIPALLFILKGPLAWYRGT